MLSELYSLNLKLWSKEDNKNFVLHLIVVPQLSSGWEHNTQPKQGRWAGQWAVYVLSYVYETLAQAVCCWDPTHFSEQGMIAIPNSPPQKHAIYQHHQSSTKDIVKELNAL